MLGRSKGAERGGSRSSWADQADMKKILPWQPTFPSFLGLVTHIFRASIPSIFP